MQRAVSSRKSVRPPAAAGQPAPSVMRDRLAVLVGLVAPAVNLAARLEKIASQTRRTIVASEGFAGICRGGWSDLGEFPVAGFAKAARVYGLADETSVT